MDIGMKLASAQQAKIKVLNKMHLELLRQLTTKYIFQGVEHDDGNRLIEAVKNQQKAWDTYKEQECELIGVLGGGASTWQSTRAIECEAILTSQRLLRLRSALRCVKRIAPEDRFSKQLECLYQLAPMAIPLEQ